MQAVGLRTHAWNTALRSILLLAGFPVLLVAMGYAVALLLVAGQAPDVGTGLALAAQRLPQVIPLALLLAAVWFAIAWFAHRRILDLVTGAKRVTEPRQEPRLWRLTEALCISRGMRLPRLSVIETPARNAFAAGLTADRAAVTVTRGLLDSLDDAELSAVLAHELAHIRNGDARLGVVAAVFVGVITLVTDGAWQMMKLMRFGRMGGMGRSRSSSSRASGGGGRGGGGALVVLALVAIAILVAVLAHLLAVVLRMALSRNREYLADAGAVEMTANADAMIAALRKVAQRPDLPAVPDQVRALFLHDAALSRGWSWFATHPPMEDRVAALVRYGGGRDPGPLPPLDPPLSPPASPSADAPHLPASSPPAGPWHRPPPLPPAPG